MRLIKIALATILILIGLCILQFLIYFYDMREHSKLENLKFRSNFERTAYLDKSIMNGENKNIFWFLQVTDIHLSKFRATGRATDLLKFCKDTVPLLKPDFVMVSGDLADSKSVSFQDSMQYEEEWVSYNNVIEKSGVVKVTKWFDIRGNHDSFNVPNLNHADNFFKKYSVQGRSHAGSYMYTHRKSYGTYSVIALDVCPDPGPKRPYNFFGVLTQDIYNKLAVFSETAKNSNKTIWFGHYPTSTIIKNGFGLKQLISATNGVYTCGHLHTWGTLIPQMYTLQPEGFLELELGDWRDERYFRIGVIDHDIFSFADVHLHQWPYVVITNPKNANFLMPHKEPVHRILSSTHIRLLVWSLSPIVSVKVSVNGKYLGDAKPTSSKNPLYTLEWVPKLYRKSEGNIISVEVLDEGGRHRVVNQPFSTSGTPIWNFGYMASLLLLGEQSRNVRVWYYTVWLTLFIPLVFMRLVRYRKTIIYSYFDHRMILACYKFANHNPLFYSFLSYLIYTVFGPLMVGEIINDHWGFVYLNGLSLGQTFIPDYSPYITEAIQNMVFVLPTIVYILYNISESSTMHSNSCHTSCYFRTKTLLLRLILFGLFVGHVVFSMGTVYLPYGLICLLLSPCRLWVVPMFFYMLSEVDRASKITLCTGESVPNKLYNGGHILDPESSEGSEFGSKSNVDTSSIPCLLES